MAGKREHFNYLKYFISKQDSHYRLYKLKLLTHLQPVFSLSAFRHLFCGLFTAPHNLSPEFPCLVPLYDILSLGNIFSPPLPFFILIPRLKAVSNLSSQWILFNILMHSFNINLQHWFSKILAMIFRYFLRRAYPADLCHYFVCA